ncbi:MAG: bifunctional glutamate N-acetyltransferase/amino-acid acetyltransferase ArgJ [Bdellovibrionaceae bacterium]|nr:bifunctional glutamate N-acetyltransferase/amino-acid acetyltransferase ArgJ [Pseudobdellovibrionaceae bacterium]
MTPGPGVHRTPLPKGFLASGVNCGVRRYRPDIGILISEIPAVTAGVFTQNECKAAPVRYCQNLLPAENIRAIFTNSGQANAATGAEGIEKNMMMVSAAAKNLGCETSQILVASTGVIGVQLDTDKILPAIPELVQRANDSAESFATAILTTDLVPKTVTDTVELSGGTVRITGISKGSGMIHPNMATMLGYLLTDAKVTKTYAAELVKKVSDVSFNMISVDGDSSTNDCCFLMANGASGIEVKTDTDLKKFEAAVERVAIFLAKSIAADGEGATKLIEVEIKGADDLALAKRAARGVTLSPLIKTAIHGEDPNWGRILARLGAEQVPERQLEQMSLYLQGILIFEKGQPVVFSKDEVKVLLKQVLVKIEVDLKSGPYSAVAWGCDLSRKYVDINTEYS